MAKAVLRGQTRGYTQHPQLQRFKVHPQPRFAINAYLAAVHADATRRGYDFDRSKIGPVRTVQSIAVNSGQLTYEWLHLTQKLAKRNPELLAGLGGVVTPECHPLFRRQPGPVAAWERT